ncbi:helix-turn-helix domain-containing protein [Streptomyces vinaceus]|uniref:helix-turn-helix domain-containing protein n=1 Tax=Streptomyces vinaceus TaxID=1960 RepID=UPI00380A7F01
MPAPKELDPSASLAALYGAKLRKLRNRAGLTQRQLGDKIPIAHSRIAQFELGNDVPPEDVNSKLDVLLDAGGDLIDLWGHVRRTPFPDWVQKFMACEAKAIMMRKFSQVIPGLAQTEAYARAVLGAGQRSTTTEIPKARLRPGSVGRPFCDGMPLRGCGSSWMRWCSTGLSADAT